jgi:hypothetical protein
VCGCVTRGSVDVYIVGPVSMVPVCGGVLLGGLLTRKVEMTPRMSLTICLVTSVLDMLAEVFGLFLGCDQPDIVGGPTFNR